MKTLTSFQPPEWQERTTTTDRQIPTASLICAGGLLLGVAIAVAQTAGSTATAGNPADSPAPDAVAAMASSVPEEPLPAQDRLREGTELVDQPGIFRPTGDRITFYTELGAGRFVVLENLALERIGRAIEDNPAPPYWLVTGTITEYRGENLLLVHRAVLRNRMAD